MDLRSYGVIGLEQVRVSIGTYNGGQKLLAQLRKTVVF